MNCGPSVWVFKTSTTLCGSYSWVVYGQHHGAVICREAGGTFSTVLNQEAQLLLRWAESWELMLVSQFIIGAKNVVADSLSCRHQVLGSEWTLAQEVVNNLQVMWPVTVDLFAICLNYCLPVYFSPVNDSMAADTFLQVWDGLHAYAFPPFALIQQVLGKLKTCKGTFLTLVAPFWSQKEWFPKLLSLAPSVLLPFRRDLLRQPHFHRLHQNPMCCAFMCGDYTAICSPLRSVS